MREEIQNKQQSHRKCPAFIRTLSVLSKKMVQKNMYVHTKTSSILVFAGCFSIQFDACLNQLRRDFSVHHIANAWVRCADCLVHFQSINIRDNDISMGTIKTRLSHYSSIPDIRDD